MKKSIIWKIILFIGICPMIIPFALGLYKISIESWSFLDWLVMYSFIYWPTYLIGIVLVALSVYKLIKYNAKT